MGAGARMAVALVFVLLTALSLWWLAGRLRRPLPQPGPRHSVVRQQDLRIPMRDGVALAADLYLPEGVQGRLPVVLIRTPYDKSRVRGSSTDARFFAGQGYAVVVQDVRGRYASEGEFRFSARIERSDGTDTLDWIVAQPWSNGRVGTYGCSYLGEVQYLLAAMRHPAHRAAIAQSGSAWGGDGVRAFGFSRYGALELAAAFGWFRESWSGLRPSTKLSAAQYLAALHYLPVAEMMRASNGPPSDFEDLARHPPGHPFWEFQAPITAADRFDVPTLHVNSWYDITPSSTLALFKLMRENAESAAGREHQFLLMSPGGHCESEGMRWPTIVGQRYLGDARFDYWGHYLRWFDHWLKGEDNGVTATPRVRYFEMGRNRWREAEDWPLPGTRFTRFYLRSGGRANTSAGDGRLSSEAPTGNEPPDTFEYDPDAPVPSLGGGFCCVGKLGADPGAFDQSEIERRQVVLVYTTPPLEAGLAVTGPIALVLHAGSTAPDTDFTAKLLDVQPNGRPYNLQDGILRARYREGLERPRLMRPDEVYELRIDLEATSNYFAPGHRIRLEVSSSSFPRWERNLNTGGNNFDESRGVRARNSVHHAAGHASHLLLPVVPDSEAPE